MNSRERVMAPGLSFIFPGMLTGTWSGSPAFRAPSAMA